MGMFGMQFWGAGEFANVVIDISKLKILQARNFHLLTGEVENLESS